MIDIIFLLLIFFMLTTRFGTAAIFQVSTSRTSDDYRGPPRLIEMTQNSLRLNGVELTQAELFRDLAQLVENKTDVVLLKAEDNTKAARMITLLERLEGAGFTHVVVVE